MHSWRMTSVAVAGASGYAGGEILRLLLGHPGYLDGRLTIGALTAAASAGTYLTDHHPHLLPLAERMLEPTEIDVLRGHDVVFLLAAARALGQTRRAPRSGYRRDRLRGRFPPDRSGRLDPILRLRPRRQLAIRTAGTSGLPGPPAWHPPRRRSRLLSHRSTAGPAAGRRGRPGRAGRHRRRGQRNLEAGRGRQRRPAGGGGDRLGPGLQRRWRAPAHPEIAQGLRTVTDAPVRVSFAVLIPTARGILATCTAPTTATADEVRDAYEKAYCDEPFVYLLPEGQLPRTGSVVGSNAAQVAVTVDSHAGVLVALVRDRQSGQREPRAPLSSR